MEKKGYIFLFLSPYREMSEQEYYVENNHDGTEGVFTGSQTNDAPVQYLLQKASRDNVRVDKIIYIQSKRIKSDKNAIKHIKSVVSDYINNSDICSMYPKLPEFIPIDYDENGETLTNARNIYRAFARNIAEDNYSQQVYIDYTGGMRDINLLMILIGRYLEYMGISCKEIVYSQKEDGKGIIHRLNPQYDLFNLINGVDQFTKTGNALTLKAYFDGDGTKDIVNNEARTVLKSITDFSEAMSLCDIEKVFKATDEIKKSIDDYCKKYPHVRNGMSDSRELQMSFFDQMFTELLSVIQSNIVSEGDQNNYIKIIEWCINNDLIQQAVTIYDDKMPVYYCEKREKEISTGGHLGVSPEKDTFTREYENYGVLPTKYNGFKERQDKFLEGVRKCRNSKRIVKSNLVQKALFEPDDEFKPIEGSLKKLGEYLDQTYKNRIGTIKEGIKVENTSLMKKCTSGEEYIIGVLQPSRISEDIYYFLEGNLDGYEEFDNYISKKDKEKRALGLSDIRKHDELLYELSKYHLAIQIIRNQMNHASEGELKPDVKNAISILEKEHGVSVEKSMDNIKDLIRKGIEANKKL